MTIAHHPVTVNFPALPSGTASAVTPSATGPSSSTAATTGSNPSDTLSPSAFMDLLIAQLKNQDPTNPMDPTTFVSQLVQFNTLENVISINQELAPTAATGGSGSSSSTSISGASTNAPAQSAASGNAAAGATAPASPMATLLNALPAPVAPAALPATVPHAFVQNTTSSIPQED